VRTPSIISGKQEERDGGWGEGGGHSRGVAWSCFNSGRRRRRCRHPAFCRMTKCVGSSSGGKDYISKHVGGKDYISKHVGSPKIDISPQDDPTPYKILGNGRWKTFRSRQLGDILTTFHLDFEDKVGPFFPGEPPLLE